MPGRASAVALRTQVENEHQLAVRITPWAAAPGDDDRSDLVYAEHVAGGRRQSRARLSTGEALLIELLAFGPTTEVAMQRPPAHGGPVQGTAMPEMTVENNDRAGGCQQRYLVRMRRGRVRHLVLRQRAALV